MNAATAMRSACEILDDFPSDLSPLHGSSTYIERLPLTEVPLKPFKLPLLYLGVGNRRFLPEKPIGVYVTQDGSWFFAENAALNVIGTGESPEEAVFDLQRHIIHFWQHYQSIQDTQVTGDAVRLKRLFSNLLVEIRN